MQDGSSPTPARSCVWPGCASPTERHPELHMCDTHLLLVYVNVGKDWMFSGPANRHLGPLREAAYDADQAQKREVRAAIPGVIYYVEVGSHIKIGWTSDLTKRMRSYPPNSRLLASHPGLRADETQVHRKFAAWRSHGAEWYVLAPVLLDHIKRVVAEHGPPEVVDFGAKPVAVPRPHQSHGATQLRARSKGSGFRTAG